VGNGLSAYGDAVAYRGAGPSAGAALGAVRCWCGLRAERITDCRTRG